MSAPSIAVPYDSELQRVIDIAAMVGDISGDEVNVSYTSLLIGLLWSNDPTSLWLQSRIGPLGVRQDAILAQRRLTESARESILKKVDEGKPAAQKKDPVSISARTVLREAASVALDTGKSASEPVGTRHLAAVYFFRNPPGHNAQFHTEWNFDKEAWRKEFAQFIAKSYSAELFNWASIVHGYIDLPESLLDTVPGTMLGSFGFDTEAVSVIRTLEDAAALNTPPALTSQGLLMILAGARSIPDCALFGDLVAEKLGNVPVTQLIANALPLFGSGTSRNVSIRLKNILDRSRSLALSTTGGDVIGVRHIIASILVDDDSTANSLIVKSGVSMPFLRNRLLKEFTDRWVNDDGVQWRFHLVGTSLPTVPDVQPDSADRGEDRLDVARYARALATVIAADRVNPPLSIGIFGDWGSGKSFFMRLMSEQTEKISAITDKDAQGNRLFCQRVVPIRFNAWHYAEGELWASLVQAILTGLRTAIVGTAKDSEMMDRILAQLDMAKVARKDAEERLQTAQEAKEKSESDLKKAQEEAQKKAEEVKTVETKDVFGAVNSFVLSNTGDALAVAEKYLGIEGVGDIAAKGEQTAGDLMTLVNDARVASARTRSNTEWLLRAPIATRDLALLGGAALLVLVAGGAFTLWWKNSGPAIYSGIVEVLGGGTVFVTWARKHLVNVSRGLDEFDQIRQNIDRKLADAKSRAQDQLRTVQRQHEQALADVAGAQRRLDLAEQELQSAQKQVEESRSVNQIARLLEDRLSNRSYEQYLGIVAKIRGDFQKLSDLLKGMRADTGTRNGSLQPIDRIVLYIDDLDRCPSDKVVSVLEAIHLLLAFELFVVVVGVDIRWAAKSLAEKYPHHLSAGVYERGAPVDAAVDDGVSALDYLEKIFQIPFWLPPMEDDASRNMIAEMVPRVAETPAWASETEASVASRTAGTTGRSASEQAVESSTPAPGTAVSAKALTVEAEERKFMLGLAGAVGKSPRRLKRFVNCYRILKASLDNLQQETFVVQGGAKGEYRAAMVLLAMTTGAPRSSIAILDYLAASKDEDALATFEQYLPSLVDASEAKYAQTAVAAYKRFSGQTTVQGLRYWAPLVSRFSFRSGRS